MINQKIQTNVRTTIVICRPAWVSIDPKNANFGVKAMYMKVFRTDSDSSLMLLGMYWDRSVHHFTKIRAT